MVSLHKFYIRPTMGAHSISNTTQVTQTLGIATVWYCILRNMDFCFKVAQY